MKVVFDEAKAKLEYERLCRWRDAWTRLACDRRRMRRLGGLQRTQDRVECRAVMCNQRIAGLLAEFDDFRRRSNEEKLSARSAVPDLLVAEVAAWRARFPNMVYRPQDNCVALRYESCSDNRLLAPKNIGGRQ